jgi:hypothetical protein
MDYMVACLPALLASGLTLFSGFGLGTILTPVFSLFFPVQAAVAMGPVGRDAHWYTVLRFGLPAALAAIAGAGLVGLFAGMPTITVYELFDRAHEVAAVKAAMMVLIGGGLIAGLI